MKSIKRFLSVIFLACAILMVFTSLSAVAQYPRFYVCLTNNTNSNVNYKASWCTRAGYDCTSYKNYTIEPGETVRHWGPEGNGKMSISMHSGGSGGVYRDYNLYGTSDGCRSSSSYRINYNNRGFLRIFE